MAYKVTLPEGRGSFYVDDLTLAEAAQVERETGETWLRMNPVRSAVQARAIVAAYLSRDLSEEEARKVVDKMTVRAYLDCIERVDDDRPDEYQDGRPVVDPKAAEGAPATT